MDKVVIVRYCEIHLKGKNRGYFEKVFLENLEKSLAGIRHEIHRPSGRYIVDGFDEDMAEEIASRVARVFGTHSVSVAYRTESELEKIWECVLLCAPRSGTFKVHTNRADKTFPLNSMELNALLGGRLLETNGALSVDVHAPEHTVDIDIRENGTALVFSELIRGAGGMPVGTAGRGTLLLSGGIDSPVAGYMIARRGMRVDAVHFHSYPYTNMQAREKVEELAQILAGYTGEVRLFVVSVTHIQEEIHRLCPAEMMITILRRFMMRLAERIAVENGSQCIITGENLGQVASQTIEGITSSNAVIGSLPVLRPLIGYDKTDIIAKAREIGTFETSILPYEDCCTVFLPKHPLIKPKLSDVEREEKKLELDTLLREAYDTMEVLDIRRRLL